MKARGRGREMAMDDMGMLDMIIFALGLWKAGDLITGTLVGLVKTVYAVKAFLRWARESDDQRAKAKVAEAQRMLADVEAEIARRNRSKTKAR